MGTREEGPQEREERQSDYNKNLNKFASLDPSGYQWLFHVTYVSRNRVIVTILSRRLTRKDYILTRDVQKCNIFEEETRNGKR